MQLFQYFKEQEGRSGFVLDLQSFYFSVGFLNNTIGDLQKCGPILKEIQEMKGFMIYELVDAKKRGTIDLRVGIDDFTKSFVIGYPEAFDIFVSKTLYCYWTPVSSHGERVGRARRLGRVVARETCEFIQKAMRSYDSEWHSRSNQLFKAVKGKKRLACCLRLLENASSES